MGRDLARAGHVFSKPRGGQNFRDYAESARLSWPGPLIRIFIYPAENTAILAVSMKRLGLWIIL